MGPSKKRRDDAWEVRRRYRGELVDQLKEAKRKQEEAERGAGEKKGGEKK